MPKTLKYLSIMLVVLSLLTVPMGAVAQDSLNHKKDISGGKMAADILTLRPLGAIGTVAGFGLFVVSVPFSALGGNTGEAWKSMVAKPAKYTFVRPLGDF